jgi:bacteriorhodopsin
LSTLFFLYILYVLFVELTRTLGNQPPRVKSLVAAMRWILLVTWLVYPIAYILPRFISNEATALVVRQIGYSLADVLAKPLFGLLAVAIMILKTKAEEGEKELL